MLSNNYGNIPEEFKALRNFTLWKSAYDSESKYNIEKASKPKKIPCSSSGNPHAINEQSNLSDYDSLKQQLEDSAISNNFGLGFVFTETDYFFIDIDNIKSFQDIDFTNCQSKKQFLMKLQNHPEISEILSRFHGAYVERSISGQGLHIVGKGSVPLINNSKRRYRAHKRIQGKTSLECYDGSTIRYMAITGDIICGEYNCIHPRDFSDDLIWLYSQYFTKKYDTISFEPIETAKSQEKASPSKKIQLCDNEIIEKLFTTILQNIESSSKHKEKYYKLKEKESAPSPSEADWHFLIFVVKFFSPDFQYNEHLLLRFLKERPHRKKLNMKSYKQITVQKVIREAIKLNWLGRYCRESAFEINKKDLQITNFTDSGSSNLQSSESKSIYISKQDFVKMNPLISKMFSLCGNTKKERRTLKFTSNNSNSLVIYLNDILDYEDLRVFLAILTEFNIANCVEQLNYVNNGVQDNLYRITVSIASLINHMQRVSSTKMRKKVIGSLFKLSKINIEYEVFLNKIKTNKIVGASNILNFQALLDAKKHIGFVVIQTSPFIWKTLKESQCNYCLFNTRIFYSFDNKIEAFLYYIFCSCVTPGNKHWICFSIDELTNMLVYTDNQNTYRSWKKRIRESLKSIIHNKNVALDMKFILETESDGKNKFVKTIKVKRKIMKVTDEKSLQLLSS